MSAYGELRESRDRTYVPVPHDATSVSMVVPVAVRASWLSQPIAAATGWLVAERLLQMGLTVGIGFWMARHLGPEAFGTLGYALALVTFITPITTMGLHGLLMRDFITGQDDEAALLGTALGLRLAGGLAGLLLLTAAVTFLDQSAPQVRFFVFMLSAGSLFQAVGVVEYWLQGRGAFRRAAIARMAAALTAAGVRIVAIRLGAGLSAFVWIAAAESVLLGLCFAAAYATDGVRPRRWRFSRALAERQLAGSLLLVVSGVIAAVYLRIDQVMLAHLAGPAAVGVYTAATRLTEAIFLLPTLLLTAAFPTLLELRKQDGRAYQAFLQRGYDLLATGALAAAAAATLGAGPIIHLLYGEAYAGAAAVLVIHVWASVLMAMRGLVSKWLIAENLLAFSVLSHAAGAALNVAANLYLIPRFGAVGAAWSTLLSCAVGSYLIFFVHPRTRPAAQMMTLAPLALIRHAVPRHG